MLARVILINPLSFPAVIAMEHGPERHQQQSLTGPPRQLAGENTQRLTAPAPGSAVYGDELLPNGVNLLIVELHSLRRGKTARLTTRAASGVFEWIYQKRRTQSLLSTTDAIILKCSGESFQVRKQKKTIKTIARNEGHGDVSRSPEAASIILPSTYQMTYHILVLSIPLRLTLPTTIPLLLTSPRFLGTDCICIELPLGLA